MGAASIVSLWPAMVVVASVVLAVADRMAPVGVVVFEALSAGSGVGSSRAVSDHLANAATKITLVVTMLAGRVEMAAFVVLLARPFTSGRTR